MSLKVRVFRVVQMLLGLFRISAVGGSRPKNVLHAIGYLTPRSSPVKLIRMGSPDDGGYLVPNDLEGIGACFSPGVAETAEFEMALSRLGIRSFMVDYSVDKAPIENKFFDFEKRFLGTITDGVVFTRLDDWIDEKYHDHQDLILQMDIEGAEYPVLADVSEQTLERFRIMIIEFHNLDSWLTNPDALRLFTSIVEKLTNVFVPVHVHPNNCCGALSYMGIQIPRILEVTFLRRDRFSDNAPRFEPLIPNPLDTDNDSSKPSIMLSNDWKTKVKTPGVD